MAIQVLDELVSATEDGFVVDASAVRGGVNGVLSVGGQNVTAVNPGPGVTITSAVSGGGVVAYVQQDPGLQPELAYEVSRSSNGSWWTGLSGLTPVKYFDARYPGGSPTSGAIAPLDDILGGADAVEEVAAQNPTYQSGGFISDGGAHLQFRNLAGGKFSALRCDSLAAMTIPYTMVACIRHGEISAPVKNIVGFSHTGTGGLQWYASSTVMNAWVGNSVGAAKSIANPNGRLSTTRASLHAIVVNGADSYIWDNGAKATGDLTLTGTYSPNQGRLGTYALNQNGFNHDLRSLVAFTGAATQSQLDSVFSGMIGQVPANVIPVGDSLTDGIGQTSWPSQAQALMLDATWIDAIGIPSATLSAVMASQMTNIANKYMPAMRNVLVLWLGTNDFFYGATPAQVIERYWQFCDRVRRTGWYIVACSMIPRGNVLQSNIDAFNQAHQQGWRNHASAAVYLHKIRGLSSWNSTYWLPTEAEKTHLSSAGYGLVAKAISGAVRTICQV